MLYKVNKQFARGSDTLIAEFRDANDAKLFMHAKLLDDARLKVMATYKLLEGMDLIEELSPADARDTGSSGSSSGSGAGAQQRTSFQPTPFNASPRPSGLPSNWLKDEEENPGDKK